MIFNLIFHLSDLSGALTCSSSCKFSRAYMYVLKEASHAQNKWYSAEKCPFTNNTNNQFSVFLLDLLAICSTVALLFLKAMCHPAVTNNPHLWLVIFEFNRDRLSCTVCIFKEITEIHFFQNNNNDRFMRREDTSKVCPHTCSTHLFPWMNLNGLNSYQIILFPDLSLDPNMWAELVGSSLVKITVVLISWRKRSHTSHHTPRCLLPR